MRFKRIPTHFLFAIFQRSGFAGLFSEFSPVLRKWVFFVIVDKWAAFAYFGDVIVHKWSFIKMKI